MANPTCTAASLVEAFPCLSGQVFSKRQQQLIQIWFMTKELNALGGTNYTSALDTTLISDSVSLARTMSLSQLRTATLAIYRNNAVAAGASIQSDPSLLFDNVKCLKNYLDLDSIILLLLCKLGVHKTFPQ